jgi:hypothetical protein
MDMYQDLYMPPLNKSTTTWIKGFNQALQEVWQSGNLFVYVETGPRRFMEICLMRIEAGKVASLVVIKESAVEPF